MISKKDALEIRKNAIEKKELFLKETLENQIALIEKAIIEACNNGEDCLEIDTDKFNQETMNYIMKELSKNGYDVRYKSGMYFFPPIIIDLSQ